MARATRTRHAPGNAMTLLHEIEWQAPLIEPYRDPDAEALMRKKYGFVMDSVAFYSRSPWIVRSQVRFDIQRDVLVHVDVDLAEIIGLVVSQDNSRPASRAYASARSRVSNVTTTIFSPGCSASSSCCRNCDRCSRQGSQPRCRWKTIRSHRPR
jgi:hypothetical protein